MSSKRYDVAKTVEKGIKQLALALVGVVGTAAIAFLADKEKVTAILTEAGWAEASIVALFAVVTAAAEMYRNYTKHSSGE
jgi:hypothetical protein